MIIHLGFREREPCVKNGLGPVGGGSLKFNLYDMAHIVSASASWLALAIPTTAAGTYSK